MNINTDSLVGASLPAGVPKHRLDHDFNSAWGSILCFDQLQAIMPANPLWREFVTNRMRFEDQYDDLLATYTARFASFFGGYLPIDYQSTTSQVMRPDLISKMMLFLASLTLAEGTNTPPELVDQDMALRLLAWGEAQVKTPRWALLSDTYAAASMSSPSPSPVGTPSSNPDSSTPHKTSSTTVLNISPNATQSDLRAALDTAKKAGCIGLVLEPVDTLHNGRVLDPALLKRLRRVCTERNLLLAMDETLSAVRCGAPFAFMREEYADAESPDLVFFGRGLAAHGTAINFAAPFARTLGLQHEYGGSGGSGSGGSAGRASRCGVGSRAREAVKAWQSRVGRVARPLATATLIQAISVIDMAAAGNFPMLSRIVGKAVRDFVVEVAVARGLLGDGDGGGGGASSLPSASPSTSSSPCPASSPLEILGGLECLVFVRKDVAAETKIMGASPAGSWIPWVRWFPRLEPDFSRPEVLEVVVGSSSRAARERIAAQLVEAGGKPYWCFCCGNRANNRKYEWCRRCCVDICEEDACVGQFLRHRCVM